MRIFLGRRWRRWIRLSLLFLCFYLIWNIVRDMLPVKDNVDNSWMNERKVFDHWGKDDVDLNWMPNLLAKRTQEIPVVVVEEHYEVLKYWFQAADLGVIPRSKNILIHIDSHVDGAVPVDTDNLPLFRYPSSRQEIYNMMQRNDMFIVTAALTGLIDHVIWVWPSWDTTNHDAENNHLIINVEMGFIEIRIQEQINRHKMDLCACWRIQGIDNDENVDASWECHRRNFSEIEAENGPDIERSQCQIHSKGMIEIMGEMVAAAELRKLKISDLNSGFILDIDEDFYGCWSDTFALQEAGIEKKDITLISDLITDLLFGLTAHEEHLANEFYSSLLHLVVKLKSHSCEIKGLEQSKKKNCLTNVEVSNYFIENIPTIIKFLQENGGDAVLRLPDPKHCGLYLQSLLLFFQNFSIKQLKVLADLGICFIVSPSSLYFQNVEKFHVCQGSNSPNNTVVTFHLPTELEIATRTVSLGKILSSLYKRPSLVTVCRSVRDGYTPKQFFSVIESNVLQSVASTFRGVQFENIYFDTNLLGGKSGWPHHSKSWTHRFIQYLSLNGMSDLLSSLVNINN
uniref:Uncharacterized protein n=1 Tax=Arion vulgaris TaxID=1028688 RepID=A0A0B6Y6V4_9EUPU